MNKIYVIYSYWEDFTTYDIHAFASNEKAQAATRQLNELIKFNDDFVEDYHGRDDPLIILSDWFDSNYKVPTHLEYAAQLLGYPNPPKMDVLFDDRGSFLVKEISFTNE